MSRYRTKSTTTVHSPATLRRDVEAHVEKLKAANVPTVDGAYLIWTRIPSIDYKVLFPARTREQRRVQRILAARGDFCGFYPVEGKG